MPALLISSKPTAVLFQKERLYAESSVYSRSFLWFCKAKDQSPAVNGLLALVFCRGFSISFCCGSMPFQQAVLLLVNVDSGNAIDHSTVHQALSGGHVSSIADGQGAVCRQQVCGIDLGGASINGHLQFCGRGGLILRKQGARKGLWGTAQKRRRAARGSLQNPLTKQYRGGYYIVVSGPMIQFGAAKKIVRLNFMSNISRRCADGGSCRPDSWS